MLGAVGALFTVMATSAVVLPASSARAAVTTTTITNFNADGQQVTRYDTAGNAIDAHDGEIALFGDRYYLYGTSYDCGYGLLVAGSSFCGFKAYSSTDLVHWTDRGTLFDARTPLWQDRCAPPRFGCYRPHVVYNAATARYVLWVNGYDNNSGYHVLTAAVPTGPFVETEAPTLAFQGTEAGFNNGDMDVFVDDDGAAYLAYTDIRNGHTQVIERLNSTYTSGTGSYRRIEQSGREAPSLFKRGGRYYYVYGPNCPYCGGTETRYRTATSPLAVWSAESTVNGNSCGGQPSFVARWGSTYLFGSDLWSHHAPNQALANYFWTPLSFTAAGAIRPISCAPTTTITLNPGTPGSQILPPHLDQTSGAEGFRTWCDIGSGWQRMQTFVAGRTGRLSSAGLTTFQRSYPDAGLTIEIYRVDASLRVVGAALYAATFAASAVGWTPRLVTVAPDLSVVEGNRYGIVARSLSTTGCYGIAYNDSAPYPGGGEAYSTDGGASYVGEANRTIMFSTGVIVEANLSPSALPPFVDRQPGRLRRLGGRGSKSPRHAGQSSAPRLDRRRGRGRSKWL